MSETVIEFPRETGPDAAAFTADTLEGRPVPVRRWQFKGLVPAQAVTLLSGDGGVGKSTLALQGSCATVLGKPWIGQEPLKGRALYLSAEDDADEIHRRIVALADFYNVKLSELDGLKIWALADREAVLAAARGDLLEPTPLMADLDTMVADWKPRLLVLDAVADLFTLNENDRGHVRQAMALSRELAIRRDVAILLLGHPSRYGMDNGSGYSGSTAWNNSARSRLYMRRPTTDDAIRATPDLRTLTVMKANYAPAGTEFRLRLTAGAFSSEDNGAMSTLDKQVATDRADQHFLEMLAAHDAQGRHVSYKKGPSYAPAVFAKDPNAGVMTAKGFEAAMNRLFTNGAIRGATKGPPSREVSFIERVQS